MKPGDKEGSPLKDLQAVQDAQISLRSFYEAQLLKGAILQPQVENRFPEAPTDLKRRASMEAFDRVTGKVDKAMIATELRISAGIADPGQKLSFQRRALMAAINFWDKKLQEPDLDPRLVLLGRRRLTKVNALLEAFDPL